MGNQKRQKGDVVPQLRQTEQAGDAGGVADGIQAPQS